MNTVNFNVSGTTPIGWCSAPALKVGDVIYMNGEKIVITETGSYPPPSDVGWYDPTLPQLIEGWTKPLVDGPHNWIDKPECTCPASDMLKDGWKCNCEGKS